MHLFNMDGFVNVAEVEKVLRLLSGKELAEIADLQSSVRDINNARYNLNIARSTHESSQIERNRERILEMREHDLANGLAGVIEMLINKLDG